MQKLGEAPVRRRRIQRGTEKRPLQIRTRGTESERGRYRCPASVGQGASQRLGERTCLEGASSESSLAWDRSDLLKGLWENSLEERHHSLSSDVCLFSPERTEGSGGVERGRVSEDGDLFSPVRRHCGGFKIVRGIKEPGSDSNGEVASGTTHEPESEEETQMESEASTGRRSRALNDQRFREEEQGRQESRPSPNGWAEVFNWYPRIEP